MRGVGLTFEIQNPYFEFHASAEKITVSVGALNLLWCASYAYWIFYGAFVRAQRANSSHVHFSDNATLEAARLYEWALSSVQTGCVRRWDISAPRPSAERETETLAVANELFLAATGWIILHEAAHIILKHPLVMTPRAKVEEDEADSFATSHVLCDVPDALVLLKRGLGIAVANIVLVTVGLMQGKFHSKTHPPAYERLYRNLRCRQFVAEHPVHAFVDAILQMHLTVFKVGYDLNLDGRFDSILDDMCIALSREGQRERR